MALGRGSLKRPKIKVTFSKSMFDLHVALVRDDLGETYTTRLKSDLEQMKIKVTFSQKIRATKSLNVSHDMSKKWHLRYKIP